MVLSLLSDLATRRLESWFVRHGVGHPSLKSDHTMSMSSYTVTVRDGIRWAVGKQTAVPYGSNGSNLGLLPALGGVSFDCAIDDAQGSYPLKRCDRGKWVHLNGRAGAFDC